MFSLGKCRYWWLAVTVAAMRLGIVSTRVRLAMCLYLFVVVCMHICISYMCKCVCLKILGGGCVSANVCICGCMHVCLKIVLCQAYFISESNPLIRNTFKWATDI